MKDLVIIGAGPAGWSTAITARKRDLAVTVVSSGNDTGWLWKTDRIDNYPGMPGVSGRELLHTFREQALSLGAEEMSGVARQIQPKRRGGFMVLVGNDIIEAKTIALCMGAAKPKLLPGEEELLGTGVSWCGTCDGMFYRGKKVAVLSYWKGGIEEADFLSGLADATDYYVMAPHQLPQQTAFAVQEGKPLSLERGENNGIIVKIDSEERHYDGVFIFRPAVAPGRMLSGLETEGAFIKVDRGMRTSVPYVYAAGDCTGDPLQVAKAVGEGNVAAISCAVDLARTQKE